MAEELEELEAEAKEEGGDDEKFLAGGKAGEDKKGGERKDKLETNDFAPGNGEGGT